MQIQVKFFAIARDKAGVGETTIELPEQSTLAVAVEALCVKHPALKETLARCAFAVNMSYAKLGETLHNGDEVAVIPPVSGG